MIRRFTSAWSLAIVLGWCVFDAAAADPVKVTVVMSGLDNPRGLALGPEGALYVAEAGRGGPGPCQTCQPQLNSAVTGSLVVDHHGTIYVTNNGVVAGLGQVLKIERNHARHDDDDDSGDDDRLAS